MMNRFFSYIFRIIVPFFTLLSCHTETITPPAEGSKNQVGIVGEMSNSTDSYIGVYSAGNLTWGTMYKFISDAQIALFNNGKSLTSFYSYNGEYYKTSTEISLKPQEKYTLQCRIGNSTYSAELIMPDTFQVEEIFSPPNITLNLTPSSSSKRNYVIAVYSVAENGKKKPVNIATSDQRSDNFIYNELPDNTDKIFFQNISDKFQTKIELIGNENNTHYLVIVKSVNDKYYQYLYYSEIQSKNSGWNIQLPSNISGGAIGFVGLAFIRKMDLYRN